MSTDYRAATSRTSGWVVFAGVVTAIAAAANLVYGLTLLINDEWVVLAGRDLLVFDLTTIGVIALVFAALQAFLAMGIFHGALWARIVGIIAAAFGIVAQMSFMSIYPQWSWLIIVVDVLVIYGLGVHGDEVAEL